VQKITFHEFQMGDVDDVGVYVAHPLNEFISNTEKGRWVSDHCNDLTWYCVPNEHMGNTIKVRGSVTDRDATEYYLRFPDAAR